ncbi:MAG: RHS repeat protein [Bacteroidales bacterium]|nr:RHS repeat protein [Bacteroidales bacterium]MCL2133422.1 RHS repeat protein [Bacteroidales bacterium]
MFFKNKKWYLTFAVFCCGIVGAYGQGDFGRVTPQTADFMRYGETPEPLFNGSMNLTIPIYRIKDQDFDIPISLLYTADGFKPEKRSDFVGLDWTLIAGGCITREVYGAPDDFGDNSIKTDKGFKWVIQDPKYQHKDSIWSMNSSLIIWDNVIKSYYMPAVGGSFPEYCPDLFMFNFNGHSGQFMINNKGEGQANHPGYRIDISGLAKQPAEMLKVPLSSTLRITTPDGYLYEFGGSVDALEYTVIYRDNHDLGSEELMPTILAWHLSKITAPNGRFVKFNYVQEVHLLLPHSPIWQAGRGAMQGLNFVIVASATKKAVLESIEVDDVKVEFKKSVEETLGTWPNYFFISQSSYNYATYQLDSVVVKHNNNKQYSYTLEYENHYKRRFLSSVLYPDGGKYSLDYNHANYPNMDALPPNETKGKEKDNYGYWEDNNSDCSFGLMNKITYPTGGYSLFEYERHQYNQAVELILGSLWKSLMPSSNSYTAIVSLANGDIGGIKESGSMEEDPFPIEEGWWTEITKYWLNGARVKSITNYSSASVKETRKEYVYAHSISSDSCSGILYQSRPYFIHPLSGQKVYINVNLWDRNYNVNESPIGYSSIFEKREDNSYIHYKFSDYISDPDTDANVYYKKDPTVVFGPSDYIKLAVYNVNKVSSKSAKRGLLVEKSLFDSNDVQKSKENNSYKNVFDISSIQPSGPQFQEDSSYIVYFRGCPGGGISRKIFLKTHPLIQQIVTTDGVSSTVCYWYNEYDQLASKAIVINQTDSLRTNYTYPTECSEWYCDTLTARNRLSSVIEQIAYRINANTPPVEIERIRTDYKFAPGNKLIVPGTVQSARSGSNLWQTELTYDRYNAKGNLLQQTAVDEVPVTILWSCKYQYPIADIRNAAYDEVENILGEILITRVAAADEPANNDLAAIDDLRNSLPNAMITTYTYKPLVGITTMTDPNGIITYYEYDTAGRLKTIKDHLGNVLQQNEYNYGGQQ